MANRGQQVAIPAPVAELVAAWNDRAADRFASALAPDVVVSVPPLHLDLQGRDEVWIGLTRLFGAFGALRYTTRHRYLTPGSVTDEALLEGLQTEEFLGAPPTGRPGAVAARVMIEHDAHQVSRLEVWPDVAALRDLSDGVARRIDLRVAGPAAPVVAALRATIPATEGKLSLGQRREEPGAPKAPGALLPGAPELPDGVGPGSRAATVPDPASRAKPKGEVPKAPVPRKVRRLRAFLAGLVMLVVAGLLVTYVVQGVRSKEVQAVNPSPTSTGKTGKTPRASAGPRATSPAPSSSSAKTVTFDPATNTYRFPNSVLFDRDQSSLRPQSEAGLMRIIDGLVGEKRYGRVIVTGYTDSTGSTAYNLALSMRRARTVATFLEDHLPASRFTVVPQGLGEADPVKPNDSDANRELNRRVEIKVPDPQTR